jgi:hypothetical protein
MLHSSLSGLFSQTDVLPLTRKAFSTSFGGPGGVTLIRKKIENHFENTIYFQIKVTSWPSENFRISARCHAYLFHTPNHQIGRIGATLLLWRSLNAYLQDARYWLSAMEIEKVDYVCKWLIHQSVLFKGRFLLDLLILAR